MPTICGIGTARNGKLLGKEMVPIRIPNSARAAIGMVPTPNQKANHEERTIGAGNFLSAFLVENRCIMRN